jgi:hypothetical protein
MAEPFTLDAPTADLAEVVRKALREADAPLSVREIRKGLTGPFKKLAKGLETLLESEAAAGRLFRYVPAKGKSRTPSYSAHPIETTARAAIASAVDETARPWSMLKKARAIGKAGSLLGTKGVEAIRAALVDEGRIYEWPKVGGKGSVRYSTRPADPGEYLEPTLKKVRKEIDSLARKLAGAGVGRGDVGAALATTLAGEFGHRAPEQQAVVAGDAQIRPAPREEPAPGSTTEDLDALILERMVLDDPGAATGAPVSIRSLRRSLAFHISDRAEFDRAIVRLAVRGRLALHRLDYPDRMSPEQRDELVPDGQGGYFVAASRRPEA